MAGGFSNRINRLLTDLMPSCVWNLIVNDVSSQRLFSSGERVEGKFVIKDSTYISIGKKWDITRASPGNSQAHTFYLKIPFSQLTEIQFELIECLKVLIKL